MKELNWIAYELGLLVELLYRGTYIVYLRLSLEKTYMKMAYLQMKLQGFIFCFWLYYRMRNWLYYRMRNRYIK